MKKCFFYCFLFLLFFSKKVISQTNDFSFAWISDTHIGYSSASKDLLAIINEINNNEKISFVVITGDITEKGKTKEITEAKKILENLKIKYFAIPGNHDLKWSESGTLEFYNNFFDDKFAFKYNGFLFLGLNSAVPLRGGLGHFASHDLIWLNTFINSMKNDDIPIIFFTHFPTDKYNIDNYYHVLKMFSGKNIQFIGVGHGHTNNKYNFDGFDGIMVREAFGKNFDPTYTIVNINNDSIRFFVKQVNKDEYLWVSSVTRKKSHISKIDIRNPNEWKYFDSKKFSVLWSDSIKYLTLTSPVVYEKKVIICDMLGRITCYNSDNGEKLWEYQLDNSIVSNPIINKGRVFIAGADGRLYYFNINDGKIIWQSKFDFPIIGHPTLEEDTVYIGTSEYSIMAVGLNSGKDLWSFKNIKGHIESRPVVYNNILLFTAWDGYLYAIDKNSKELLWKWSEKIPNFYYSPAASSPIVIDNRVILTAPNKYLTIIDILNGNTLWRSNLHPSWESIGFSEKNKKIYVKGVIDTLFCYSLENDSLKLEWFNVLGYGFDISPIEIIENNNYVYVPASNGFLYCVDAITGKFKWEYFLGEAIVNKPIILEDESIIVSNIDGIIKRIKFK